MRVAKVVSAYTGCYRLLCVVKVGCLARFGRVYEGVSLETWCFRTLDEVKAGCVARIQFISISCNRERVEISKFRHKSNYMGELELNRLLLCLLSGVSVQSPPTPLDLCSFYSCSLCSSRLSAALPGALSGSSLELSRSPLGLVERSIGQGVSLSPC